MPETFKQLPVLIGNPVTSNGPVAWLYDEQETHLGSNQRFFWPYQNNDRPESKEFADTFQRPIVFECGFDPRSLTPFFSHAQRVIAVDDRPWSHSLFRYSCDPKTIETYKELQKKIPMMMEIPIFLRLKHMAGQIKDSKQAGIALFLLARIGGKSDHFKTFEASIKAMDQTGNTGTVPIRRTPLVGTVIVKRIHESIKTIVYLTNHMSSLVHVNINFPPSNIQEASDMLYHLTQMGYSWTVPVDGLRQAKKYGSKIVTLDKQHYLVG